MHRFIAAIAFLLSFSVSAAPQDWWGQIELPGGQNLRFAVRAENSTTARLDIPQQGVASSELHDVRFTDDSATFTFRTGPSQATWAHFEIEFIDGDQGIGVMRQAGGQFRVLMTRGKIGEGELPDPAEIDRALGAEHWSGASTFTGGDLAFAVTFRNRDGRWEATLDIPAQGVSGVQLDDVLYSEDEIRFTLRNPGPEENSAFWELERDGNDARGICKQVGGEWATAISRVDSAEDAVDAAKPDRPQHPEPPFPYRTEEVTFRGDGNFDMAGTLTLPDERTHGEGPYPGVVLISGSGQQDRDETIMGHKPFLVIADRLTKRGIAVLRYDDRGVGGSGGPLEDATTSDFAADVRGAIRLLWSDQRVDNDHVGLVGHSEGGLIAPMVAAGTRRVSFIALLAGMGLPGDEVIVGQAEAMALAEGVDPDRVSRAKRVRGELVAALKADERDERVLAILRELIGTEGEGLLDDEQLEAQTMQSFSQIDSAWYRALIKTDPATYLKQVKVPVLALQGDKDLQVLADDNLGAIKRGLEAGHNPPLTIRRYPMLNHLFQVSATGALSEYGTLTETFNEAAIEDLGDWILEQTSD